MRGGQKRFWHRLKYGQSRCFRCGHKFRKDEEKFFMYPPLVGGEQVCAECKAKEPEHKVSGEAGKGGDIHYY